MVPFVKEGNMVKFWSILRNPFIVSWIFAFLILAAPALTSGAEGGFQETGGTLESAVIKQKGEDGLVINGKRCLLSQTLIILDIMGKEIPLCDLPVPCEATVEYDWPSGDDPVCIRVEVTRLLEGDTGSG